MAAALDYDAALDALHGASFAGFVAERKRLAGELKAAGDADGAKRLAAINRPPLSAWAVNQLWRRARKAMDALFAAAKEVQAGDLGAAALHRDVLADLRTKAAEILRADGNAAAEPTMRRITQTLQGVAAAGGFEPDPPGQLTADRDPPGFEALAGLVGVEVTRPEPRPVAKPVPKPRQSPEDRQRAAEAEAAAKQRAVRRRELDAAARTAERAFEQATRELDHARTALAAAQDRVATADAAVADARGRAEVAVGELEAFDAEEKTYRDS